MGEEAMQTNDNIRGVKDNEEVYIPGAGCLGKLNHRDLRRLNQEADFDTRYIMLSNFSFTILSFESIYRFGKDLEAMLRLWPSFRPARRSRSLVTHSSTGSWSAASALQNSPTSPVIPSSFLPRCLKSSERSPLLGGRGDECR